MADYNSDRTGSNIDFTLDKVDALDAKVQPTATGVDVTGTITADGLTVDGAASITNASDTPLTIAYNASNSSSYGYYQIVNNNIGNPFEIHTGGTKTLNLGSNGDVSFYEDTGTTAKMVWDASEERVLVGSGFSSTPIPLSDSSTVVTSGALEFNKDGVSGTQRHGRILGNGTTNGGAYAGGLDFQCYAYDGANYGWFDAMRIDSAGNVGIGNTSPETYDGVATTTALVVGGTAGNNGVNVVSGSTSTGSYMFSDSGGNDRGGFTYYHTADLMTINTGGSERARIDSSGNLLVGTTTGGLRNSGAMNFTTGTDAYSGVLGISHSTNNADGSGFINFSRDNAYIGSISQSGTTGVSYNTTSDERLKENIKDTTHVVNIDDIQVREYDWKSDGSHQRFGFIAQELETVYPEAVTSPEDEDEMKSVDYSKLVPLLVKEIQNLKSRIEILENKHD